MEYIASFSGGKDSAATVILAHEHNEPLDEIIFSEVMYSDTISGELPEHIDFVKNVAFPLFEKRGYKTRILHSEKNYLDFFHRVVTRSRNPERIGKKYGFPISGKCFVNAHCKLKPIKDYVASKDKASLIQYIGLAIDEPERLTRLDKGKISLLAKYGYTEEMARDKAAEYGLLSPCYGYSTRSGCWFCPNAGIGELLHLRNKHSALWNELLDLEEIPDKAVDLWDLRHGKSIRKIENRLKGGETMGRKMSSETTTGISGQTENSQTENTESMVAPAETTVENGTEVMTISLADEKSYKSSIKKINDALSAVKKSFLKIAFALEWIDTTRAYELDGYENIESLAKDRFGIGRTSVYNYIHVARRFGAGRNVDTGEITGLDEAYKAYSPTQLIILYDSGITNGQIKDIGITPALTCAEIKSLVKSRGLTSDKPKNNTPDNGTSDSGITDGGTPDSSITDGGTPDSGTEKTPDGKCGPARDKGHYAKTNSLLTVTSLEDFDRQKNDILDLIRKTLSQDGFQCAVTISMSWN